MDEKHGFQSEDLVEATSAMPGCTCPLCMNSVSGGTTVSPAPSVSEHAAGSGILADPKLADYELSEDGEVVIVLRSYQVTRRPIKLLTFSTPHELNMLIRSLHSVLSEASSAKGV